MDELDKAMQRVNQAANLLSEAWGFLDAAREKLAPKTLVPRVEDLMEDEPLLPPVGSPPVTGIAPSLAQPPPPGSPNETAATQRRAKVADDRPTCAACGNPLDDEGRCRKCAKTPLPAELERLSASDAREEPDRPGPEHGWDHGAEEGGFVLDHEA